MRYSKGTNNQQQTQQQATKHIEIHLKKSATAQWLTRNMAADFDNTESAAPDSLTLGQLKKIVSHFPKPKVPQYDFRYDDSDNLFNELDECYSYVEIGQIMENRVLFEQAYEDGEDNKVAGCIAHHQTGSPRPSLRNLSLSKCGSQISNSLMLQSD